MREITARLGFSCVIWPKQWNSSHTMLQLYVIEGTSTSEQNSHVARNVHLLRLEKGDVWP